MSDNTTTIRERVAMAICAAMPGGAPPCPCAADDGQLADLCRQDMLRAADAAIAIIVEVYRNGQSSLIDEERKELEERYE